VYPGYGAPGQWQQRPSGATVITGAVIQIVQSAIALLIGLVIVFIGDAVDSGVDDVESRTGTDQAAAHTITGVVIAIGVLTIILAVFLIVLAALAIRRQRWAVITSVVLQGISVVLLLIGMAQDSSSVGGNIIALLLGVSVIVLFLVPATNRYLDAP
jgi:hypothetical protein